MFRSSRPNAITLAKRLLVLSALAGTAHFPVRAQAAPAAGADVQSPSEALAEDAGQYALLHGVSFDDAFRRLRAQEESVAVTEQLAQLHAGRLAGIAVEHQPAFRIVVLLTGTAPVPDQMIRAGGLDVLIVFRTGAAATGAEVVASIRQHQGAIRSAMASPPGMGLDPRTGELVLLVRMADAERHGRTALRAGMEALTGVPVRIGLLDGPDAQLGVEGGERVVGIDPADGHRYVCTTGFVVTDGARTGIATAAHCPDALTHRESDGGQTDLDFVGQWGAGSQDVQIHLAPSSPAPVFRAGARGGAVRTVIGARARAATRAGDTVCHRGERSGYSCSQVQLVDYAPPGDLCGGPCEPTWVTVAGPGCGAGDSGGPVFIGNTALGIAKGGSYNRPGSCAFYYYMSADYLPAGWSLLREPAVPTR
jgi:hypothetical protein